MIRPMTVNTDDAAKYLSLSRARLAKLRCDGGGPTYVTVGRTVLYRLADLDAWLEANARSSTRHPPAPLES